MSIILYPYQQYISTIDQDNYMECLNYLVYLHTYLVFTLLKNKIKNDNILVQILFVFAVYIYYMSILYYIHINNIYQLYQQCISTIDQDN